MHFFVMLLPSEGQQRFGQCPKFEDFFMMVFFILLVSTRNTLEHFHVRNLVEITNNKCEFVSRTDRKTCNLPDSTDIVCTFCVLRIITYCGRQWLPEPTAALSAPHTQIDGSGQKYPCSPKIGISLFCIKMSN